MCSLPPPSRFRLFTVFFHVPDHSKAQDIFTQNTQLCGSAASSKKEEVAGEMLGNGFPLISGCRIHKKQSEITPALKRHRAEDLGAGSRHDNCILSPWCYFHSKIFALSALFEGLSTAPVGIEIPHGSCCLLLLQSP